jgi:hypothetical protein
VNLPEQQIDGQAAGERDHHRHQRTQDGLVA